MNTSTYQYLREPLDSGLSFASRDDVGGGDKMLKTQSNNENNSEVLYVPKGLDWKGHNHSLKEKSNGSLT